MSTIQWLYIYLIVVSLYGLYKLSAGYFKERKLFKLFFLLSIGALLAKCFISLFGLRGELWAKLSSVLFVLSGLLELVRVSRPVYYRFPSYLSFLPVLSLLFLPMIRDSRVLYNLIHVTYQGGALLVALIVVILWHIRKGRLYGLVTGIILLLAAYITNWVFRDLDIISFVSLGTGIIFIVNGFDLLETNEE